MPQKRFSVSSFVLGACFGLFVALTAVTAGAYFFFQNSLPAGTTFADVRAGLESLINLDARNGNTVIGTVTSVDGGVLVLETSTNGRIRTYTFRYDADTQFWGHTNDEMPREIAIAPEDIRARDTARVSTKEKLGNAEEYYAVTIEKI